MESTRFELGVRGAHPPAGVRWLKWEQPPMAALNIESAVVFEPSVDAAYRASDAVRRL